MTGRAAIRNLYFSVMAGVMKAEVSDERPSLLDSTRQNSLKMGLRIPMDENHLHFALGFKCQSNLCHCRLETIEIAVIDHTRTGRRGTLNRTRVSTSARSFICSRFPSCRHSI